MPEKPTIAASTAGSSGSMGTAPFPSEGVLLHVGRGGPTTLIIPAHDLEVVRMGCPKGCEAGDAGFKEALALLKEAVPASN